MKDFRGIELNVGDDVVWAARAGSSCWLTHGRILEIDEDKKKLKVESVTYDWNNKPTGTKISRPYVMRKLMKVIGFPQ